MKKVYLSGPIQSRSKEKANEWRDRAIKDLEIVEGDHYVFQCLNPMSRQFFDDNVYGVNEIVHFDKQDVEEADIILVNYNVARQKTTLCGTSMEVFYGHSLKKFIVAFTDLPKEEWSPWMIYHCTKICESYEEAIKYIKECFNHE